MHIGDAAVGRPRLRPVENPFAGGLVVTRPRADRADVGTGVGLRRTESTEFRIACRAEHLGQPPAECLLRGGLLRLSGGLVRGRTGAGVDWRRADRGIFRADRGMKRRR